MQLLGITSSKGLMHIWCPSKSLWTEGGVCVYGTLVHAAFAVSRQVSPSRWFTFRWMKWFIWRRTMFEPLMRFLNPRLDVFSRLLRFADYSPKSQIFLAVWRLVFSRPHLPSHLADHYSLFVYSIPADGRGFCLVWGTLVGFLFRGFVFTPFFCQKKQEIERRCGGILITLPNEPNVGVIRAFGSHFSSSDLSEMTWREDQVSGLCCWQEMIKLVGCRGWRQSRVLCPLAAGGGVNVICLTDGNLSESNCKYCKYCKYCALLWVEY